ncbi:DMT family transporter [Piscinibacter sp. XHJ-5]|uniref:DMT family transporter n=1 Tax=Piscinibacter sp. XHJ-5 TaxID=3037797 RepID=UPI0024534CDD|nr:DMT family transporter [Piscinibacter sp. XHJ-5]
MSHRRALAGMIVVTLLWSIAGVVTRFLDSAQSFEVTFWRSLFTAIPLGAYYAVAHGRQTPRLLMAGGKALWISGLMWSVMFTCFMVAITLTTVANVLVTMSVAPLFTALLARFMLGHPVKPRTWLAIVVAGAGIAWMYGANVSADSRHLMGTLVALGVPIAGAINWNILQRSGQSVDLVPALLIGALISSAVTLPLSMPFQATAHDIGLLAMLGLFQLAIPCALSVRLARFLPAPEISLLALLEIVFGIAWAWLGANEQPAPQVLTGGALVLGTLALNEAWGLRRRA